MKLEEQIVLLLTGLLGFVFVAISIVLYRRISRFLVVAQRTVGVIEDYEVINEGIGGEFSFNFFPVVSFFDSSGVAHRVRVGVRGQFYSIAKKRRADVGTEVPIFYHPDDPKHAKIAAFGDVWGIPLSFGLIGVVFLGAAICCWLWSIF